MPSAQAEAHRRDLAQLVALAENDLRILFDQFDTAEQARDGLMDVLPALVAVYGAAAATLAADWYDDLRETAGAPGRFLAIPAELPDRGRTDILARWAVAPMFAAEPDPGIALSKTVGGLQRIVADAARYTVTVSTRADPRSTGWRREGTGGCDFCRDRLGDTYRTEVVFDSHDRCHCIALPTFG